MFALGAKGCWFESSHSDYVFLYIYIDMSISSLNDFIIFFVLLVISIFWLLDSNFSILLNFVLLYILIGLLVIILGYEFLGISVLLVYSSGIAIIFIITSMILGTRHISSLGFSQKEEKNNSTDEDIEEDNLANKLFYNAIYFSFFALLFFMFNIEGSFYNHLMNLLIQFSFAGLISNGILIYMNDIFIVGFLIYNQYLTHTVIAAFMLLVSLVASVYISQLRK